MKTTSPSSIGCIPRLSNLWLNECKKLQVMSVLQPSLRTLQANNCPSLESINLRNSNVKLEIEGCHKLSEINGFFDLEVVNAETILELLKSNALFNEESIPKTNVHIINMLIRTCRKSPIQVISLLLSSS